MALILSPYAQELEQDIQSGRLEENLEEELAIEEISLDEYDHLVSLLKNVSQPIKIAS